MNHMNPSASRARLSESLVCRLIPGTPLGFLVCFLLCFALPLGAQLQYVEAWRGLGEPGLDGGNTELEMGDVNGDGFLDLLMVGDHGSPFINTDQHGVTAWLGDGRGGFTLVQTGTFGYGGLALGDVNNDGFLDVGYGVHHNYSGNDLGDQLIEVALGDGSGSAWTPWDDGLGLNGETWGMFGTDFADVDADGDLDLVSISFGCCAGVRVYLNLGDGSWQPTLAVDGGNSNSRVTFGDVNGDGLPDIGAAHDAATVYVNLGGGSFAVADANLPAGGFSGRDGIAFGDVDRDGRDDIAWIGPGGEPEIWSLGVNGQWSDLGPGLPAGGPWLLAQLLDLDGDGWIDLAAFGDGQFTAFRGDGGNSWTPFASFTTPGPGNAKAFRGGGDIDHNGRPDLAWVATESGDNVLHLVRERSLPRELTARWVAPGPQSTLIAGSVRFLDWMTAVPSGQATVSLAYSTSGPGGPWTPIARDLVNSGRYQWIVPTTVTNDLRLALLATANGATARALSGSLRIVDSTTP